MDKFKKILIGTHNRGKFKELSYLVSKKLKKLSPLEYKIKSPVENGKSFRENSELKANYFYKKTKINSLSDDSGLCVNCLGNKPGIYSARWADKNGSFEKAMRKIIKLVNKKNQNKKKKNFKAKFVCSLTLQLSKKKKITAQGEVHGKISNKIIGKNGFGYDPLFIPKGHKKTFGQMNKRKKMLMDHRYIAFKKLKKKIKIL